MFKIKSDIVVKNVDGSDGDIVNVEFISNAATGNEAFKELVARASELGGWLRNSSVFRHTPGILSYARQRGNWLPDYSMAPRLEKLPPPPPPPPPLPMWDAKLDGLVDSEYVRASSVDWDFLVKEQDA
jgi:hypothetical protein